MAGHNQKVITFKLKAQKYQPGEMAERLNAAVLKTVIPRDRNRGFESLSLLQSSLLRATTGAAIFLNESHYLK